MDEAFGTHSMVWGRGDMYMGDSNRTQICYLCVSVWMLVQYTAISACVHERREGPVWGTARRGLG
jgi:hypothetical protein